jgi:glycosyltransferase involved in cell wall biosynthesis
MIAPMKVLFLLPQLVFGNHGGLVGGYVNSVVNLAEVMQHECEVLLLAGVPQDTESGRKELAERLNKTDIRLMRMCSKASTAAYFAEFLVRALGTVAVALRKKVAQLSFVYGHSGHPAYGLATWLIARMTTAIPLHAFYCPVSTEFQHKKMGRLARTLAEQSLRRVPYTIAISENVRQTLLKFSNAPCNPVVIVPAIPDALFRPSTGSTSRDRAAITLGFVGHHKPEKGFDLALAALKSLLAEHAQVTLIAVVSGAESQGAHRAEITAMVRAQGLEGHVELISGVHDMRDFYERLDLLLIPFRGTRGPSDYPMVLLEAMALGVPVVCTPVGAMPEVVIPRENGFLATSVSEEAFSAATFEALQVIQTRQRDLVERATETARQFQATEVDRKTRDLLTQIMEDASA